MRNMDYTERLWDSYIAFNLGTRVEEYELRSKSRLIYYAFGGFKFTDISYASNYSYLYMTSKY